MDRFIIGDVVFIYHGVRPCNPDIKVTDEQMKLNHTFGIVRDIDGDAVRVGRWWWPKQSLYLCPERMRNHTDILREEIDLLRRENEILRSQLGYSRDEKLKGSYGV